MRPDSKEEENRFLDIVESYVEIHCKLAIASEPVSVAEASKILDAQIYYCTQQQQNDKTRRVLEKAFGQDWAEHYMTEVLFDFPK